MSDYRIQILAKLTGFDECKAQLQSLLKMGKDGVKIPVSFVGADGKLFNNSSFKNFSKQFQSGGTSAGAAYGKGVISGLNTAKVTPTLKQFTKQQLKEQEIISKNAQKIQDKYGVSDPKNAKTIANKYQTQVKRQKTKIEEQAKKEYDANLKSIQNASQAQDKIQAQQRIAEMKAQSAQKNAKHNASVDIGKTNINSWASQYAQQQKQAEKEYNALQKKSSGVVDKYEMNDYKVRAAQTNSLKDNFDRSTDGYHNLSNSVERVNKSKSGLDASISKLRSGDTSKENLQSIVNQASDLEKNIKSVGNSAKYLATQNAKVVDDKKLLALDKAMESYSRNNTRMGKYNQQRLGSIQDGLYDVKNIGDYNKKMTQFEEIQKRVSSQGLTGRSAFSELSRGAKQIGQFAGTYGGIQVAIGKIGESIGELKEVDSIITEISKTSDLTSTELKDLGNASFGYANKYGKNVSDYLTGVQEMSRSGFYGDQAKELADLSVLAQAAGDMTATTANSYLLATDAAYDYNGDVTKLNATLDGQNMINTMVMLYGNIRLRILLLSRNIQ